MFTHSGWLRGILCAIESTYNISQPQRRLFCFVFLFLSFLLFFLFFNFFLFFSFFYGLACFVKIVLVPGTLAPHLLHLDRIATVWLTYSVSQSVTT